MTLWTVHVLYHISIHVKKVYIGAPIMGVQPFLEHWLNSGRRVWAYLYAGRDIPLSATLSRAMEQMICIVSSLDPDIIFIWQLPILRT